MKRSILPLMLAGAVLSLAGCGSPAETATDQNPRRIPVRVVPVERRDLDESLALTGTLRPHAQVLVTAEVSARLLRIQKDEGERVAEGESLAVLDDTDYRLSGDRAEAAFAVARANQAHAVVERDRADGLLKTGGITDKEHLAAQVNLQIAEASLAQARAEAAIAKQQLARTAIRAPFSGRVAKRMADAGAMLATGTTLFTLVDDRTFEFRAAVPSADYATLRVGAPVEVTVDSLPGFVAKGRVARVSPLVEERTRAFEAVVEIPGDPRLLGGLFARAEVRTGRIAGATVVPPAALVRDGARAHEAQAFVVTAGKADRRTVSLGIESASAIQVTKGLEAGDLVVIDPPAGLGGGAPVEVQTARATK